MKCCCFIYRGKNYSVQTLTNKIQLCKNTYSMLYVLGFNENLMTSVKSKMFNTQDL